MSERKVICAVGSGAIAPVVTVLAYAAVVIVLWTLVMLIAPQNWNPPRLPAWLHYVGLSCAAFTIVVYTTRSYRWLYRKCTSQSSAPCESK